MEFIRQLFSGNISQAFGNLFGNAQTGPKPGAIGSVGIGLAIGTAVGNLPGALIGGALGLFAGGFVNELLFGVGQVTGANRPPPQPIQFVRGTPTEDLPAPVQNPAPSRNTAASPTNPASAPGSTQPPVTDDQPTQPQQPTYQNTTVRAPMLEQLIPPEDNAIHLSLEWRETIRKILRGEPNIASPEPGVDLPTSSEARFTNASARAVELETSVGTFLARMDQYGVESQEYVTGTGNNSRNQLVQAVLTASGQHGHQLTSTELDMFVPQLPTLPRGYTDGDGMEQDLQHALSRAGLPLVRGMTRNSNGNGWRDLDLEESARDLFTGQNIPPRLQNIPNISSIGTEAQWNEMSGIEKSFYMQRALDHIRHGYENGTNALDRSRLPALRTNESRLDYARRLQTWSREQMGNTTRTEDRVYYQDVFSYSYIMYMHEQVSDYMKRTIDPALDRLSEFRNETLVQARQEADRFRNGRLQIFNEQGIAILREGSYDDTHRTISYRDLRGDSVDGSQIRTMVLEKNGGSWQVTHLFNGMAPENLGMVNSASRINGSTITLDDTIVTNLTAPAGQNLANLMRQAVGSATAARFGGNTQLVSTDTPPLGQLASNFVNSSLFPTREVETENQPYRPQTLPRELTGDRTQNPQSELT